MFEEISIRVAELQLQFLLMSDYERKGLWAVGERNKEIAQRISEIERIVETLKKTV
jgi:hypothetical protein